MPYLIVLEVHRDLFRPCPLQSSDVPYILTPLPTWWLWQQYLKIHAHMTLINHLLIDYIQHTIGSIWLIWQYRLSIFQEGYTKFEYSCHSNLNQFLDLMNIFYSYFFFAKFYLLQVNQFQKHLFLQQLTHNMKKELNSQFNE